MNEEISLDAFEALRAVLVVDHHVLDRHLLLLFLQRALVGFLVETHQGLAVAYLVVLLLLPL